DEPISRARTSGAAACLRVTAGMAPRFGRGARRAADRGRRGRILARPHRVPARANGAFVSALCYCDVLHRISPEVEMSTTIPAGPAATDPDLASWRPDWDTEPLAEFPVYTRANIGEVIPGIISPLGATAGSQLLDAGFILLGRMIGAWEP